MKTCPDCRRCYDDRVEGCEEKGHAALLDLAPGTPTTIGPYRLDRQIGGGDGGIFAGRHLELDRPVAIRLLPSDLLRESDARERFLGHARALAAVSHRNLARVYDSGILPEGVGYVAVELVEGETLRELLEASGPLPVPAAAEIGRQVALALEAAHHAGAIHGHLGASDVVLTRELGGRAVARVVGFESGAPAPVGQRAALVPFSDEPLDVRSDVLALGMMLYEMLAGRSPFAAPRAGARRRAPVPPLPLQSSRPEVPEGLGWLVAQCLLRNPSGRPQTAAEVAERLLPFEAGTTPARAPRRASRIKAAFGSPGEVPGAPTKAPAAVSPAGAPEASGTPADSEGGASLPAEGTRRRPQRSRRR